YIQADVDVAADPWWCLSAGMEGSAGLDIDITIDFWIFDIEIELVDWETPPIGDSVDLGCAEGPAPSQQAGGSGGEAAIATFARSYGGDNLDGFTAILPTDDGGALVAGSTNSFSPTPRDAWLVKVDALGHVGWQLAYGDLDGATDLVDMGDGYLVTAGRLGATVDTIDLVRIDDNGAVLWARRYGHPDGVGPARVVRAQDGGFLVAGTLSLTSSADFFAARFDAAGELLWARTYGGADGDEAWAAVATSDGGFLLVGDTSSFGVTYTAIWAVKLDGDGDVEWQRVFDQGGVGSGYAAVESPLGGYLIGGHIVGAGLLLRLAANGSVTWARYYDAGSDNDYLMAAAVYPDGSFGAIGSRGLGAGSDLWALRISDPGNVLWSRAIGGADHESTGGSPPSDRAGQPVAVTADGGLLAGGKTESWGTGFDDAWLLKLTHNGFIELEPASGATSTALAGSLSTINLAGAATSVTPADLALGEGPVEVERFSTQAGVLLQGGPP
ncbi:MAG TPA: hypothetical protein VFU21_21015, partial [Kofleriaceae bacterium]|nr:hypothetical protein [Kofleriaceae bacterium]